jgi:4-amino-4-deoxy-L-arabinose transferase-like glycosyltransferase
LIVERPIAGVESPPSGSHPQFWHQAIIVLTAGVICFVNLGVTGLWDLDEALYTSIAREMSARGDWVVPTFNNGIFYDKPPLMFWLMMGSFKLAGLNEFAARLPSAILAVATALATYRLARRMFSAEVGLWAGLVVASNIIFIVSARAATVDSALTFVTVLAMALFAKGARLGEAVERSGSLNSDTSRPYPVPLSKGEGNGQLAFLPSSWSIYAGIGLLLGLAILAKGPVGFLLPAAGMGLFLAVMNAPRSAPLPTNAGWFARVRSVLFQIAAVFSPRNLLRVTWAMRPLTVLAVAALVALPWFALVAVQTDGKWLEQFVTKYNVGPFVKPFLGHQGPFYYHFVVVLIGLFPWSVFMGPTLVHAYRSLRARGREMPSYVLLACWIGVFFGFWSVCSTKLPHYVLPAYPALAILTGCFLQAWLQRAEAATRYVMPIATSIFLGVGAVLLAVLPLVTARYAPGEQIIALVGLVLLLGGGTAMYCLVRDRRSAYLAVFATTSVLFVVMLFAWAAVRIDRHQHSRSLLAEVRRDSPAEPQIAAYKYCDASTVYYAGGPVEEIGDATVLRDFMERSAHPYIVTTGAEWNDLESRMPGRLRVIARRPRFLSKGEIVVVAPRNITASLSRREL